jgi:hypothetical protein
MVTLNAIPRSSTASLLTHHQGFSATKTYKRSPKFVELSPPLAIHIPPTTMPLARLPYAVGNGRLLVTIGDCGDILSTTFRCIPSIKLNATNG